MKLRTSDLAGTFTGSIRTKAVWRGICRPLCDLLQTVQFRTTNLVYGRQFYFNYGELLYGKCRCGKIMNHRLEPAGYCSRGISLDTFHWRVPYYGRRRSDRVLLIHCSTTTVIDVIQQQWICNLGSMICIAYGSGLRHSAWKCVHSRSPGEIPAAGDANELAIIGVGSEACWWPLVSAPHIHPSMFIRRKLIQCKENHDNMQDRKVMQDTYNCPKNLN